MQLQRLSTSECEHLFNTQASHWQGEPFSRKGMLPLAAQEPDETVPIQNPNGPWWVSRTHDTTTFSGLLLVEPDLELFDGHFPGNPILPGVVQIDWAVEATQATFKDLPAVGFSGMSRIKFKTPIKPGAWLKLQLSRKDNDVGFVFLDHEGTSTEGRLHYHA